MLADDPTTRATLPPTLLESDRFVLLDQRLSFDALDALLSHADLFVGNDSGPKHLASLRGTPVVVNQWASWCGPCRTEFPHFREQARDRRGEVAFLGVDAMDSRDAAARFLEEQPTGFEHFYDPDAKIARSFGGGRVWPATAFYDAEGEMVYLKQGTYATEQDLAEDIDRYALGG